MMKFVLGALKAKGLQNIHYAMDTKFFEVAKMFYLRNKLKYHHRMNKKTWEPSERFGKINKV